MEIDIEDYLSRSISNGGKLILTESELGSEFFNLSRGNAGELMQKFVNYNQRLAIIISNLCRFSSSFQQLVSEHKQHPNIRFFDNEHTAKAFVDGNSYQGVSK